MRELNNPRLQYAKGSNNFYVYIPRSVVKELNSKQGDEIDIEGWAKIIKESKEQNNGNTNNI